MESVSVFVLPKVCPDSQNLASYRTNSLRTVPVYVAELAPPSKRGRVVGAQQWAITWGIMIMFYISYGCSYIKGTAAFRVPWGLQMIPAIILGFALFFTPESPRYVLFDLKKALAWDILTRGQMVGSQGSLGGSSWCLGYITPITSLSKALANEFVAALVHAKGNRDAPFVLKELHEIREFISFEAQNKDVSYLELIKPNMIYRLHVGVFTQIWSQLTGMNVMMYCKWYGSRGESIMLI